MKTVVLLSGGMDSVTALYWARHENEVLGAVSFDYGAKHNHREIPLAAWHCLALYLPWAKNPAGSGCSVFLR